MTQVAINPQQRQGDLRRAESVATAFIGLLTAAWLWPIVSFLTVTAMTGAPGERLWAIGAAAFACALGALSVLMPQGYYRLRAAEAGGQLYLRLGVLRFRTVVLNGDLMNRWLRRYAPGALTVPSAATLRGRALQSRWNGRIHLAAFLFSLPVILAAGAVGGSGLALYLGLINLPLNVYPILLQRYTRGRLDYILSTRYAGDSNSTAEG
jgi:hypothetical protein